VCLLFLVPVHTEPPELSGGAADTLDDNSYLAFLRILVRDCDGDALGVIMQLHDDKLPGLAFLCDKRRFNAEQLDIGGDEFR